MSKLIRAFIFVVGVIALAFGVVSFMNEVYGRGVMFLAAGFLLMVLKAILKKRHEELGMH